VRAAAPPVDGKSEFCKCSIAPSTPGKGALIFGPMAKAQITRDARNPPAAAVDRLVLAAVNAPYRRAIDATTLTGLLAGGQPGDWSVHLAAFFTDVHPSLVFAFADAHGLSGSELAKVYLVTKKKTGERNPELEADFVRMATTAS